ncbi:MAG: VWA domain-containing protein [Candidatus Sulfotelmatobacter sp.]|jgi:VWFA-related protein
MTSTTIEVRARYVMMVALIFFAGGLLPAQQSPSPSQTQVSGTVFKSVVNRVIVDVVVTDAQGKPVHGLTRRDFSVTEDDVPQRVLTFDVHNLDAASESVPPNLPPLPVNTFLNLPPVPERGPLCVLLLDLVNTEMPDQMWARQQLLKFTEGKPAGTRFAVFVLSDALRLVQGFTTDKDLLFAALDPKHPRHHVPKVFLYSKNYGEGDRGLMISVFQDIARYLDGLPGRKNVMWMADSFPMSISPVEGDPYDLNDDLKDTIDTLARGQVAVYTFTACGISVDDPGCGGAPGSGGSVGAGPTNLPIFDAAIATNITTETGGKRYSTNDFKGELDDATEDGANYYTLSYAPTNSNYNGKERHIKVHVAQHGYRLDYRRSYFAVDPNAPVPHKVSAKDEPEPPAPRKPGDSLIANMEFGAPLAHQLIFRAHLQKVGAPAMGTSAQMDNLSQQPAYFQVRRKNRPPKPLKPIELQTYAVDYTVLLPKTEGRGGAHPLELEFATAAFDADGTMLNGVVENGSRISSPDAKGSQGQGQGAVASDASKFYRAQLHIDVPLAAVSIRVAVRDMATDRIGALEVALPLAPEPQTADNRIAAPAAAQPPH